MYAAMLVLVVLGLICLGIVTPALALHHQHIHSKAPPPDGIPEMCLLQPKDFCVGHCTHENWIVGSVTAGLVLLICSAVLSS